jgi:hypothetical protein
MKLAYDLEKIKFATDGPTFERAVALYEGGKVLEFQDTGYTYTATVLGSQPYQVFVSSRHYDQGSCTCYLGQNETLCKHMVAVALYAVMDGKPMTDEDKKLVRTPSCSGKLGTLNRKEILATQKTITADLSYIKPYRGPSRIWFAYQNSLEEGCNRLSALVSDLPVSEQTAGLLVDMLLRLDKKLSFGGVDDSNGTVGGFIEETVDVLKEYARLDPSCVRAFEKLKGRETCFGWEEPLLELIDIKDRELI